MAYRQRIVVLANRRVIGESVAAAIQDRTRAPVAVGSTDPKQATAFRRRPDVVVIVGNRADGSTSAAVITARRRWRHAVIVALADTDRVEDGMEIVRQGADTWLSRSDGLDALRSLLARITSGERQLLPPEALALMAASVRRPDVDVRQTSRLTGREGQVLVCFARGLSRPEIAAMLAIELPTLRTHVQNILRKLEVHSIQQAAALARQEGLASGPELASSTGVVTTPA
jgi:DNA-binding NarL/FixJ family response regulator